VRFFDPSLAPEFPARLLKFMALAAPRRDHCERKGRCRASVSRGAKQSDGARLRSFWSSVGSAAFIARFAYPDGGVDNALHERPPAALDIRFFDAYDLEVTAPVPEFVSRPAPAHAAANDKDVGIHEHGLSAAPVCSRRTTVPAGTRRVSMQSISILADNKLAEKAGWVLPFSA